MTNGFHQLVFEAGSVFTPGAPINERDLFAGRLAQVRQIVNSISQCGYQAVLFGERGVGKTSLSNVLADFLTEAGQKVAVCRINCDGSDTFTTLWKKALQDIVVTRSRPRGWHPARRRVEAALQRAARHAAASEHLWEIEQARWREAEIARNRPRPKRAKLYPC